MKYLDRLWHSPTVTTWGRLAGEAVKFAVLTPLLLTRFDQPEIAAWYLFASLLGVGSLVHQRMAFTMSRMVSMAMGGAMDLRPIARTATSAREGEPQWSLVERVYGTVGLLSWPMAIVTLLLSAGIASYALGEITSQSSSPPVIWLAFAISAAGQFLDVLLKRYEIALRGMAVVAACNRWAAFVSLVAASCGVLVLVAGFGLVTLCFVVQLFVLLDVLGMRRMLRRVHEGRFAAFEPFRWDREILGWAWGPFWRGLGTVMANNGVVQFGSAVFAKNAPVELTAAFLLSLRAMQTAHSISIAPFTSHSPTMARLLATGSAGPLSALVVGKLKQAQFLFVMALAAGGVLLPYVLSAIGANASVLSPPAWFALGGLLILQRYGASSLLVAGLGNRIVCVPETIASGILSVGLAMWLIPTMLLPGLLIAVFVPSLVLLNLKPQREAAGLLDMSPRAFLARTVLVPLALYCVTATAWALTQSFN